MCKCLCLGEIWIDDEKSKDSFNFSLIKAAFRFSVLSYFVPGCNLIATVLCICIFVKYRHFVTNRRPYNILVLMSVFVSIFVSVGAIVFGLGMRYEIICVYVGVSLYFGGQLTFGIVQVTYISDLHNVIQLGVEISEVISLLQQKTIQTKGTLYPINPTPRTQIRCEPSTARNSPGKRFLQLVPKAPTDEKSIIHCLTNYAINEKDKNVIVEFKAKIEDFTEQCHSNKIGLAYALCWLYTGETFVYKAVNALLREDSPNIEKLAPYMNALMKVYNVLKDDESIFFHGIVYRRTKLIPKMLQFYEPGKHFVWSGFTSTTTIFSADSRFGDTLFVITVPEEFKKFALNLENISSYPTEKEVLLLPNIAFHVEEIEQGPSIQYPNTSTIIKIIVDYVCVTI